MVCPRSTLSTSGAPIQMSARVWSIGIDVIEKIPSSRPHCSAISSELNATASTPGRKRCRSYHKVDSEYGITNPRSQIRNHKSENRALFLSDFSPEKRGLLSEKRGRRGLLLGAGPRRRLPAQVFSPEKRGHRGLLPYGALPVSGSNSLARKALT